jgi:hypothetical protein
MDYYFVAKNKNGGLVGQLTLDEIARRFHEGELPGQYVAAASTGSSYAEFMQSGTATWVPVDELVANPHAKPRQIHLEAAAAQSRGAFVKRYLDLYRAARLLVTLGASVKTVGIVVGAIIFLFWLIVGFFVLSQTQPSSPFGPSPTAQSTAQTVTFLICLVIGTVFGALVGGLFFLLGVVISALGQLLMTQADSAVHTSPFLTHEERAAAMSLPYTTEAAAASAG